jgi:hypothetical protein
MLAYSILPSATQNEIGFPIYHFTGYGARRTPAKSHLLGCVSVAQQNLLIASNGTEYLVLPITAEQGHHLAQHQRGITLTISSAVTIQAHVQGLER